MKQYRLTAKRNNEVRTKQLFCSNDSDAQMEAMFFVLNKAKENIIWAKGEISLMQGNTLIAHMEPKL
jgi:hypothetical protein